MLFCSIKRANRGYIQVLLATSRNRIYFRRRSILIKFFTDALTAFLFKIECLLNDCFKLLLQ
ncbi:hypothetical protein [Cardinium endosymbiont of Tipula unca]|uniref:hypothetical protein n=1 Tax=Cardinium endosymbiont of Tipula unca TaxID=3066216 RepID=UPI0030CF47ED